ncbi:hypothetical protein [Metabacillus rhizolycopersici]|uniref:Lipoprotein n=1 Tax=Metabacillus rhizolycopersici TaxID=2875709 RepID=A0ABS7URM8_9BACI|nr:hypothetical protein [Metabacillus rhizolycopersici]MBZ5750791.1 hypothetical protein [Metabacillus rhizolycopersici]
MKKFLILFGLFVLLLSVVACSSKLTVLPLEEKSEQVEMKQTDKIEKETKDENGQVQEVTSTGDIQSNQRELENENTISINKVDAESLVREHLGLGDNHFLHVEVDHEEGNKYVVHMYEIVNHEDSSHTATYGWYYVYKDSGKIEDMME